MCKTPPKTVVAPAKPALPAEEAETVENSISDENVVGMLVDRLGGYTCPFVVYQHQSVGRGFLFIQTPNQLAEFRYTSKVDFAGRALSRCLTCHYMTVKEFEGDVLPNLPDLSKIKGLVRRDVKKYDYQRELVVLIRFGCGWSKVFTMKMEPNYVMCLSLIKESDLNYAEMDSLEINIDKD
eukprot:CAMPEP_0175131898 /NCGR_PEP_ID=MMETSP0087-20121206/6789_1 /TAXON_ID=136419 /ORGANISM="Unknown Unknown, Strain D1" /LENGTH=180 /DNA_ID=CAMNT_0016414221 /DNA_START=198 /DNA_END=740 /DNA_ORIENTATION=+